MKTIATEHIKGHITAIKRGNPIKEAGSGLCVLSKDQFAKITGMKNLTMYKNKGESIFVAGPEVKVPNTDTPYEIVYFIEKDRKKGNEQ